MSIDFTTFAAIVVICITIIKLTNMFFNYKLRNKNKSDKELWGNGVVCNTNTKECTCNKSKLIKS
jgi:hypothetical protein